MKTRKITDKRVVTARQMYRDGLSPKGIAEFLGVEINYACSVLYGSRYADVPGAIAVSERRRWTNPARKMTSLQVSAARDRYEAGENAKQIAESMGFSNESVRRAIKGKSYMDVPGLTRSRLVNTHGSSENMDRIRKLITPEKRRRGSLCATSVLDEDDVLEIKAMILEGRTMEACAEKYHVSPTTISAIATGKTWAHICGRIELPKTKKFHKPQGGSNNPGAKLDEVTVGYIKWHLAIGVSQVWLAKTFKVNQTTISQIFRKLRWQHVKPKKPPQSLMFTRDKEPTIRLRGERLAAKFDEVTTKKPRKKKA